MGRRRDDEREDRDERERPSWREIDRLRDHPEERERAGRRGRKEPSTSAYKAKLDKLFDEGEVVATVEQGKGQEPKKGGGTRRATIIRKMRAATDPRDKHAALDELVAAGEQLPSDTALLASLIDHPDQQLVRQILLHLEDNLERQPLKHKASFVMRLDTLRLTADDPEIEAVIDRLLDKL